MKTVKKELTFPFVISAGGVSVKINRVIQTKKGKPYTVYIVDYVLLGQRKQVGRADLSEAKEIALDACHKIASGQQMSLTLSSQDRLTYQRALEALAPAGIALDVAVVDFVSAIKQLPRGTTLKETVEFYRSRHLVGEKKTVSQVVEEMMEVKRRANLSEFHLRDLGCRLKKFAESFNVNMDALSGALIQRWLDEMEAGPRTKQNYLRIIATLFHFAIKRKYLPKDSLDEIEGVQPPKQENKEVEIFTPEEMQEMLKVAHPEIVPWLAIAGFAGLRSAEIDRLDWSEINLQERHIEIKASKAKTAARRIVPIMDNLAQWLAPHAKESGKLIEFKKWWKQILRVINAVNAQRPEGNQFKWKRNGMRHSFCSYRLAVIKNAGQVALEAGNSPQMVFKHYRQVVTDAEAAKWFAIVPAKPVPATAANIVELPAEQQAAA